MRRRCLLFLLACPLVLTMLAARAEACTCAMGEQPCAAFGADNPRAPLYVVMAGGLFLLIAALCVSLVRDTADRDVPEAAVIRGDEHEPLTTQGSAQPVPSTGLLDDER